MASAEVSDIKLSDPLEIQQNVTLDYHVKIPGYATRTGKRLFLTPEYFQFNHPARFTSSSRQYNIYFPFPWSEIDDVDIELPKGYQLDYADAPAGLNFGSLGYQPTMFTSPSRRPTTSAITGSLFSGRETRFCLRPRPTRR